MPQLARLCSTVAVVVVLAAACGDAVDVTLVPTETAAQAAEASQRQIDDLRSDEEGFDEDGRCAVRSEAQPLASAVATEAGVEITRAESFASGYESESATVDLYFCDWQRPDDITGPEGIEGIGISFGPYTGEPAEYAPDAWEFSEDPSEVASSEVLDPVDDGAVVFTCIDFEDEGSDDVCQLDWIRDGLAVSLYAYGEGVFAIDPEPLVETLTASLPTLVEAIAGL